MFTAALFTTARSWKQPKCPSTDEWIKKMWYIYTMEYYSAIKSNEIRSFVETWMDIETVIQSEVSQKEKNKYHILMHVCGIQKNGTDELVCKAEIETQMQRTNVWTPSGSFAETWMDLETVIQSEVEKNKYRILTHVCGIQKNKKKKRISWSGLLRQFGEN